MTTDHSDQQPVTPDGGSAATPVRDVWAPPSPDAPASTAGPWASPDFAAPQGQWQGTNGLAIGALVTGLTCCLWPFGLGLGIAALVQLRKREQRGRALAVSGVVLGVLGLLASTAVGLGFARGVIRPPVPGGRAATAWLLKVGDCFNSTPAHPGHAVPASCSDSHSGEVAARPSLGTGSFPGAATAEQQVAAACRGSEAAYVTDPWARPEFVRAGSLYPSDQSSWLAGHHTGICYLRDEVVGSYNGPLRRDASNLTPVQQLFLLNLAPLDNSLWLRPTTSSKAREQDYRDWIQSTSIGISLAKAGLEVQTWPPAAQTQVAALLTELRADQQIWAAAAKDTDTPVDQLLATVSAHSPEAAESAARTALSLADRDRRLP